MYLYKKCRCDKKDKNHDINNKISILVSIIRILIFLKYGQPLLGVLLREVSHHSLFCFQRYIISKFVLNFITLFLFLSQNYCDMNTHLKFQVLKF